MNSRLISRKLNELPAADRLFLKVFAGVALAALLIGLLFGLATALIRTGYAEAEPVTGYRMMTAHGVTVFFYWLYFAQMAFLLALAASQFTARPRIAWLPVAWLGLLAMVIGFAASQSGTFLGSPLLYDGSPDLVGENTWQAGVFYLGYVLLAAGLFLLAMSAIATTLAAKSDSPKFTWSTIGFAVTAWAGLVMVSSLATLNTFAPAAAWAFGFASMPANHGTGWHLLFHNLHYLPLMGTVIVWYAVIQDIAGVGSIFGQRFSKMIFTLYLVFVPPTSLYHMFLEPDLSPFLRGLGSLLSLFISVPTIAVFLVIMISLEAHARAQGARGLFGWLRAVPWHEPAITAIGWAVVNLALGGIFAFVLIQERLAPLLSDTFFVPAYFHFLTIGTVTLTLLAAFAWAIPAVLRKTLLAPALLRALPAGLTFGLALFGGAGMAAGLNGMPRRVLDPSYDGAAPQLWAAMSPLIAAGAVIMAASLTLYLLILAASALGTVKQEFAAPSSSARPEGNVMAIGQSAWTAPLAITVLVTGMYVATLIAFAILRALPLVAGAASGAH
ncbi:MAG: cbb3-type cytochrome c oxidase subunit I [Hyphomicrobiales bacterium]|nr:cbb3-type cytochrome c oxidase subunit I [Hyphomicrobiales bacterium]